MIETLNTHRPRLVHNRARSTSSTSGSSIPPRTPIDDFDEFHREATQGRLGADFSVIKMGTSSKSIPRRKRTKNPTWDQDSSSSDISEPPPPHAPLPPWLASTFSTLATKHPLRLLLPRQANTEPTASPSKAARDVGDDSPFAFCAPADPIHAPPPDPSNETENDPEPSLQSTQTPPRPFEAASIYRPPSLPDTSFDTAPPFSTPGPSPVVSRSILAESMPPVHFPEQPYVECVPPSSIRQTHCPEPTYPTSFMQSPPPVKRFLAENIKPPSLDFFHNQKRCFTKADSPNHSAYIDIFSTPGPGYRTVPPVYFDSPTEDPSDSDPLEPGYELDSLDFRWEPFIQKGKNATDATPASESQPVAPDAAVVSNSDDYYYEIRVEPEGEDDEDGQLHASINMGSPGPFSFSPPAADLPTTHPESPGQNHNTPATPERPVPPFFAPVPGIFISPLRGDDVPTTPPKVLESAEQDENPHCSQASNDTIEDWDDDTAAN
ncbi:hypothetical protein B0H19DRAFT_39001 [Mycena capillaripes]|nr:hypothetical protein B0H19DRAFT_39001 [Mycena capillaripes]